MNTETPGHRDQSANCEHDDHDDCAAMVECEADGHGLHDCGCACHTLTERPDGTFAYPPGHFTAMASPETPGLREALSITDKAIEQQELSLALRASFDTRALTALKAIRAALAANVRVAPSPAEGMTRTVKPSSLAPSPKTPGPLTDWDTGYVHAIRDHDECCGTLRNHSPGIAPSPDAPGPSLDAEKVTSKLDIDRVAAFLHDEYGCRMSCRGGRLADDRHPSHSEAYRDQAERLVAALGDGHE